jgi:hypothetical protein
MLILGSVHGRVFVGDCQLQPMCLIRSRLCQQLCRAGGWSSSVVYGATQLCGVSVWPLMLFLLHIMSRCCAQPCRPDYKH